MKCLCGLTVSLHHYYPSDDDVSVTEKNAGQGEPIHKYFRVISNIYRKTKKKHIKIRPLKSLQFLLSSKNFFPACKNICNIF